MRIPGYSLKRLIAEGGMSSVYLATQRSLGRRVAVKVLKKFDSLQHTERFLHEARIIASLEHSNIITIYDVGTVSDRHYIAMEFLEGGSLADRIEQGVKPSTALDLLESIARCLDFVHRKDIVHRDIKPSNILFHADGTPKLSDFGIAKQLDGDQELTMDGSAFGSPYYLSPEQAECRPLDGRSDIYSLGIVFYQMLMGRRPYVEKSHIETIVAHLSQPIPLLPEELSGYQGLLERMIAKRPEERVDSAQELIQRIRKVRSVESDLRKVLSAGRYSSQTHGVRGRQRGILDRLRGMSTAVRVTAVVALLTLAWGVIRLPGGPEPAQVATAVKSRSVVPEVVEPDAELLETQILHTLPEDDEPVAQTVAEQQAALSGGIEPIGAASSPRQSVEAVVLVELPARVDEVLVEEAPPAQQQDTAEQERQDDQAADPVAAADAPVLADPIETVDRSQVQIAAWMSAADSALRANRLTRPAGNNAYAYYLKIAELDPEHQAARAGLDVIADRYVSIARRAMAKKEFSRARRYLRRGAMVRPGHAGLRRVGRELDEIDRAAALARADAVVEAPVPVPVEPRITSREFEDTIVNSRGPEGTGNIVTDFKHVWHSVFD